MIRLLNGTKKYGKEDNAVYALNECSIEIESGEICIVIGPSGSGKSTLLNVLGGIDRLDSGKLYIDKEDISNASPRQLTEYRRKYVGFIFQFYNLIADLTVKENIKVVSDISTAPLDIEELMDTLDISDLSNRFPRELSGGQQQRVAIGRALIKQPGILLCDELTGALDSKSSLDVLQYIQKIHSKHNTTVIMVTHNERICDIGNRVIKLRDGSVTRNIMNKKPQNALEIEF